VADNIYYDLNFTAWPAGARFEFVLSKPFQATALGTGFATDYEGTLRAGWPERRR
jgi:hypothetical protein